MVKSAIADMLKESPQHSMLLSELGAALSKMGIELPAKLRVVLRRFPEVRSLIVQNLSPLLNHLLFFIAPVSHNLALNV
jgi:hypothetical protein